MPSKIHVYLLGRTALDRHAYRLVLERELRIVPSVESGYCPKDVWSAKRSEPDLAIAEMGRADTAGRECTAMILRLRPQTRVVVISATIDPADVSVWSAVGLSGYVVKDGGPAELTAGLQAVLSGQSYYSDGVRDTLASGRDAPNVLSSLSRREAELLPLLARGLTLRAAAAAMAVSYKTADCYRTSLLRKLGLRDRVELTRFAIRQRLVEP